jgi:uncharacterized protein
MAKKRREIENIISLFVHNLRVLGIDVQKIFLYGSYARGEAKNYSDIDVAVVSPSFRNLDIFERQEILSKAHHQFGEPLEPIGLTPEQVKEKRGFAREILETGILIYPQ